MNIAKLVLEKLSLGYPLDEVDNLAEQHLRSEGWAENKETDVADQLSSIKELAGNIEDSISTLKSEVSDIKGLADDIKEYIKDIERELE